MTNLTWEQRPEIQPVLDIEFVDDNVMNPRAFWVDQHFEHPVWMADWDGPFTDPVADAFVGKARAVLSPYCDHPTLTELHVTIMVESVYLFAELQPSGSKVGDVLPEPDRPFVQLDLIALQNEWAAICDWAQRDNIADAAFEVRVDVLTDSVLNMVKARLDADPISHFPVHYFDCDGAWTAKA